MRRILPVKKRRFRRSAQIKLAALVAAALLLAFNAYVDKKIRPTLMELAEYQARALTLQAMHTAVAEIMGEPGLGDTLLYQQGDGVVQIDAMAANRIQSAVIEAVQGQMQSMPEQEYTIPFGSLTGNSLLSGRGPGWKAKLRPEGYVQADWQEKTESLSINTTRYSASLKISVTVNMILDGRSETLTVSENIPVVTALLNGGTPSVYASALD